MKRLWFEKPASEWSEALPIGNGRLGGMIFGGVRKERISLNQDSIWYGGPIDRINPEAKSHLEDVRKLIFEGQIPEAEKLLRYTFSGTPQSERPYQPLGDLELSYEEPEKQEPEGYERGLDLEQGIVEESYRIFGKTIRKTYFSSYPHGVMVVHLEAEDGTVSLDTLLRRGRFYDHAGKMDPCTIYMDGKLGENGVSYITALRAVADGGEVSVLGEHLVIREAKSVTLYIGCETSFYENDPENTLKKRLENVVSSGYQEVLKLHQEDYRNLYDRVSIEIGEAEDESLPTLMEEGKRNGFSGAFAALYYQYGRYLLIASSRPGSLPANLQGIWNESMEPAWDSKYTININTEMNYWPAEMCDLPECHLPLFDHLLRMWEHGKETAKRMYGCRGFMAHHNTDLWGDCAPQDIYIPATYWVMGGAWLSTHIWIHYTYTRDLVFLKKMYPILRDAVLFFEDYLMEVHGQLLTCPSVSPENTYILPSGVSGCICAGASMDNQILRDLIDGFLEASRLLDISDEAVKKAEEILPKLPPNQIGKNGQIMEWREDYEEMEPGHRHISQLYALHPSHQITPDKTPALARAAAKTLERRLSYGGGHTGWSCAWIINFYARLRDGENAWENLNKLWKQSTFLNLMDNHPRKDGFVFQIDGNFGATAAITEMVIQSEGDRIILLPAIPADWKNGSLHGVRAAGGAKLDIDWENGVLKQCSVQSERVCKVVMIYRGIHKEITVEPGRRTVLSEEDWNK